MASDMSSFDVIVIGAGIMGSSTAYYLAKRKRRTLLLEQFSLPHTRGSSHGQTRGIRMAYPETYYAKMTEESLGKWMQLEKESNIQLFNSTGLLVVGAVGSSCLEETHQTLKRMGSSHERLSHDQLSSRYPQFSYPENYEGVLDKTAGILWSGKALTAYQTRFRQIGGILREGEKVLEILPGTRPIVVTSRNRYSCNSVVIAAGPWTSHILRGLSLNISLKTFRVKLHYWRVSPPDAMRDNSPCMSEKVGDDSEENYVYHTPAAEYPGHVKISMHAGPEADPEYPDERNQDDITRNLADYVRAHFPQVIADSPSITEGCMYTVTPDHQFVLDRHPGCRQIIIGAGFSGHGFKMAPVVGELLGQMSLDEKPSFDLTPFRIGRLIVTKSAL